MPGEEDFGITSVEALASGKPVIAFARGGALETVPQTGGILYAEQTDEALRAAIKQGDSRERNLDLASLQKWEAKFSEENFAAQMRPRLAVTSN